MDKIDLHILQCLRQNARARASDISAEVRLSTSAVIERIRKMENAHLIEAYTVLLDQKQVGNELTALMEISLEHPRYYDAFTEMVAAHPNIADCYYLTGEFDFMLKILTDSSDSLEQIHRTIKSIPGVSATKTHFVLKTVKCEPTVLPTL